MNCRGRRHPLTEIDREGEDFQKGVYCRYCIDILSNEQKKAAADRHLQIGLSKKRKQKHLGYDHNAIEEQAKCILQEQEKEQEQEKFPSARDVSGQEKMIKIFFGKLQFLEMIV